MMARTNLLVVALLPIALLDPASANDTIRNECGIASVYSTVSEETASGEDTQAGERTAAHRSLSFGTVVRVDNRDNGQSAVVKITDRGPFVDGRIVDVSRIAARELGFSGLADVCLDVLSSPDVDP